MDQPITLGPNQVVQHEGWLWKRGSGFDPDAEKDNAQANRKLIKTVINREGRGERKRFFVLATEVEHESIPPSACLYYFNRAVQITTDVASAGGNMHRLMADVSGYKGRIPLSENVRTSVGDGGTMKVIVPGRTYFLRVGDDMSPIEQRIAAAQWQTAIDAAVRKLWQHTNATRSSSKNKSSKLRKISALVGSDLSDGEEDEEIPSTLEGVLDSPHYRGLFREYCTFALAQENIQFYEAVEAYEQAIRRHKVIQPPSEKRGSTRRTDYATSPANTPKSPKSSPTKATLKSSAAKRASKKGAPGERTNKKDTPKKLSTSEKRAMAMEIVNKYVEETSDLQVNLSSEQRKELLQAVKSKTPLSKNVFVAAKDEIFLLMEKNFFRRFYREEQRKTGCFAALYTKLGLDGYNAVLSHFGPVQTDLERIIKMFENNILRQVMEQIAVIQESLRRANGVAVPEYTTSCAAILQLYGDSALRLRILQDYSTELREEVIGRLRGLLKGIKRGLQTVADENAVAVEKVDGARKNLATEVERVRDLVQLANDIGANNIQPQKTPRKMSRGEATNPKKLAAALFKTAVGTASTEERIEERLKLLDVSLGNIAEEIKVGHERALKSEQNIDETERFYSSLFVQSLDKLESLELHRLEQQREIMKHALFAQKSVTERLLNNAKRKQKAAEEIDNEQDLALFLTSLDDLKWMAPDEPET